MNALLDTNVFLFWASAPEHLSKRAYNFVADGNNTLFLSAISGLEIAVKASLNKMHLPETPALFVDKYLALNHIDILPVQMKHSVHVYTLPLIHKDPFDRLLIAQAQIERIPIISSDSILRQYAVEVIW
jgi:PIN domain nuclease of toxin-antitoxin system